MPSVTTAYQSLTLVSKIYTYFDADGNHVESRDSDFDDGELYFSAPVPAGAIIQSSTFYCDYEGGTSYGGTTTISGVSVSGNGSFSKSFGAARDIAVYFTFKSKDSLGGGPYQAQYTQERYFTSCRMVTEYILGTSSGSLNKSSVAADGSSTITMTVVPNNAAYSHKARWKFGSTESIQNIAAGATTATLTVPLAWCAQIPAATSGTAQVVLETYNGATLLGSKTYYFTVNVPASVVPSVSLAVEAVGGFNGLYLQGVSMAKMTATAGGNQGSSIAVYQISGGGYSGNTNPYQTGALMTAGVQTFVCTVADSRGQQATASKAITVTAYTRPSITSARAVRCTSDGTETDTGTYIKIVAAYDAAAIPGNTVASATVKYRKVGTTTWTNGGTVPNNENGLIFGGNGIAVGNSYEVVLTVQDTVGQATERNFTIAPELAVFEFRSDRAGIGRVAGNAKTLALPDDWTIVGGHTIQSKKIPANADINNYTIEGFYYNPMNAETQTMSNRADNNAFGLIVVRAAGCIQIWMRYSDETTWTRRYYNGSWTSWVLGFGKSVYPVGSIYMSVNTTSPATLFGGTWSAIPAGRFLIAAGTGYSAGSTGGKTNMTGIKRVGDEATGYGLSQISNFANRPVVAVSSTGTFDNSIIPPYKAYYMWERIA